MFLVDRYRFGVARLLFLLYVLMQVNGVVFRHAHRLSDGTIICHAHPYKGSPGTQFPNHTHSHDELIWLDAFANAPYTNAGFFSWVASLLFVLLWVGRSAQRPQRSFATRPVSYRHRGPPVHLV